MDILFDPQIDGFDLPASVVARECNPWATRIPETRTIVYHGNCEDKSAIAVCSACVGAEF